MMEEDGKPSPRWPQDAGGTSAASRPWLGVRDVALILLVLVDAALRCGSSHLALNPPGCHTAAAAGLTVCSLSVARAPGPSLAASAPPCSH